MSAQVFMCYAPEDQPLARYLAVTLQAHGVNLRSHSMPRCDQFLLVWSVHAAESREVSRQVDAARAQGLPMVALIVGGDTPPPDSFAQVMCSTAAQALTALATLAQRYGVTLGTVTPPDAALFAPRD